MIKGFYPLTFDPDKKPAPHVRAYLLPGYNNAIGRNVDFLVDTGADRTCIHPMDVRITDIPSQFAQSSNKPVPISGLGGSLNYFPVPVSILFSSDQGHYLWKGSVLMCDIGGFLTDESTWRLPSLLGRDILDSCLTIIDPTGDSFVMHPRQMDEFQFFKL